MVHSALILNDREFLHTSVSQIEAILSSKVQGSLLLDEFFNPGLDFFILLRSLAGISGNWSQSAYSAATCFQANLIHGRRARGLPASIIHLGAVSGMGMVARMGTDMITHIRATTGSHILSERDVDRMFAEAILAGSPDAGRNPEIVTGCELVSTEGSDTVCLQRPIYWDYLDYHVHSGH